MSKDTRNRPKICQKLADNEEARIAVNIVQQRNKTRSGALNVMRAIRMYAGLLQGDTSLLIEYFPGLALSFGKSVSIARPKTYTEPVISYQPKSEEDDLSDFADSIGFELEF